MVDYITPRQSVNSKKMNLPKTNNNVMILPSVKEDPKALFLNAIKRDMRRVVDTPRQEFI